jgi:hypothetical protein
VPRPVDSSIELNWGDMQGGEDGGGFQAEPAAECGRGGADLAGRYRLHLLMQRDR